MVYCFDIDGTICTNTEGNYENAKAYPEIISQINELYDKGHRIILFTARGTTTGIDWRDLTSRQIDQWGVCYHELILGKPYADIYIDDKGIHPTQWMQQLEQSI